LQIHQGTVAPGKVKQWCTKLWQFCKFSIARPSKKVCMNGLCVATHHDEIWWCMSCSAHFCTRSPTQQRNHATKHLCLNMPTKSNMKKISKKTICHYFNDRCMQLQKSWTLKVRVITHSRH
jgi:hypothetical protein